VPQAAQALCMQLQHSFIHSSVTFPPSMPPCLPAFLHPPLLLLLLLLLCPVTLCSGCIVS
jgi:hypothetical protein